LRSLHPSPPNQVAVNILNHGKQGIIRAIDEAKKAPVAFSVRQGELTMNSAVAEEAFRGFLQGCEMWNLGEP
jgi:hypothetical protein